MNKRRKKRICICKFANVGKLKSAMCLLKNRGNSKECKELK
jgi:hypothetical protein